MSLVFSILQKDFALLAADHRHTRGDRDGTYLNDTGTKVLEIMDGQGVLGFAGQDFGEQIVIRAKNQGLLDKNISLEQTAGDLSIFAQETYTPVRDNNPPTVQILLVGFTREQSGIDVATSFSMNSIFFNPNIATYPYSRFEVIGKSGHGALYGLHRFGNQDLSLDAALRLSALVLWEICQQDTSTGGSPQLYVLRPGKKVEQHAFEELVKWAQRQGMRLRKALESGDGD